MVNLGNKQQSLTFHHHQDMPGMKHKSYLLFLARLNALKDRPIPQSEAVSIYQHDYKHVYLFCILKVGVSYFPSDNGYYNKS